MGLNSMPWIVAKEANLFEKNGLNIDMIFVGVSTVMVQSMLLRIRQCRGPWRTGSGFERSERRRHHPDRGDGNLFHPVPDGSPADYRDWRPGEGKKSGSPDSGRSSTLRFAPFLERNNIKDVTILQMGGLAETMAGLSKGSVDGSMVSPLHTILLYSSRGSARSSRPKDLRKLGIGFLTNGVVARRSYAAGNRDVVVRMIKATAEGTKLMTTNEGLTKKLISKYLHIDDPELLQQSYLYVVENFARDPSVTTGRHAMDGATARTDESGRCQGAAELSPPPRLFDNSYVEELKQSGFFESLWK